MLGAKEEGGYPDTLRKLIESEHLLYIELVKLA